jgi:hypothetical protein
MKKCAICSIVKEFQFFSKCVTSKDGLHQYCKSCQSNYAKALSKSHPGRSAKRTKEWRQKNPILAKQVNRNASLKRRYGINKQNGLCAICKNPETMIDKRTKAPRSLAVDHCENTKQVRGLLCKECNTAIGSLKHDISLLESAILYLQDKMNKIR